MCLTTRLGDAGFASVKRRHLISIIDSLLGPPKIGPRDLSSRLLDVNISMVTGHLNGRARSAPKIIVGTIMTQKAACMAVTLRRQSGTVASPAKSKKILMSIRRNHIPARTETTPHKDITTLIP